MSNDVPTTLDVFSDHGGQFPWTSRQVVVGDNVRQAVVDEGPRSAPLTFLCVHGNPTWGYLYRAFIRDLARDHRVIVPDHVGFGRSDKPREMAYFTLERHILNLTRCLDELDARNVILVVQDWGGPIGMGWATRHADRVAGVVILNTWAFVREPVMKLPWLFRYAVRGKSGYRRVVDRNFFVEKILGRYGTVARLSKPVLDAYRSAHPHSEDRLGIAAFPRMIPETHDTAHRDWATMAGIEDGLPALAAKPALVVWGTKDRAFRKPHMDRWMRAFETARGPFLLAASHYLQEDAPAEIIGHIRDWLPGVFAKPAA